MDYRGYKIMLFDTVGVSYAYAVVFDKNGHNIHTTQIVGNETEAIKHAKDFIDRVIYREAHPITNG